MNKPRKRRSSVLDATVSALVGVVILSGLGIWQLDRKISKENLIATLNARLSRAPEDLPPRASWPRLRQDGEEFRRLAFPAEFLDGEEALVYTAGSPLRPDVKGPGYWVFAPARLAGGSIVLINRGFVPDDHKDPAMRAEGIPHGIVDVVGVMRWPEIRGSFTPADDPKKNVWYLRDSEFDCHIQEMGDCGAVLCRSGDRRRRPVVCRSRASSKYVYLMITCNMPLPGLASRWRSPAFTSFGSPAGFLGGKSISCESSHSRLL